LPSGWKAVRDAMTGRVGYACVVTGRCQWGRPTDEDGVDVPLPKPTAKRLFEAELRAKEKVSQKDVHARWLTLTEEERGRYVKAAATSAAA